MNKSNRTTEKTVARPYTKQELFEMSPHGFKQEGARAFTENQSLESNPYSFKDNSREVQIKHSSWVHGWYESFISLKCLLKAHLDTVGEDQWASKTKEYLTNVLVENNIKSEGDLLKSNNYYKSIFTLNN
jgi:hypothetical protein